MQWARSDIKNATRLLLLSLRLGNVSTDNLALLAQLAQYSCLSSNLRIAKEINSAVLSRLRSEDPLQPSGWTSSQAILLDISPHKVLSILRRNWVGVKVAPFAAMPAIRDGRMSVGYLSYSFGSGVRNGLLVHMFGLHDRRRFRVVGVALRPHDEGTSGEEAAAIERRFDVFVDARAGDRGGERLAGMINKAGIDVLVELIGLHSQGPTVLR